ncbi:hypothetical protein ACNUDN_29195 [Mycobacterium sp. smrl_JER01]|uniref:Uncharacterized protein n=1 Tax=Mycolicibacterium gilvum (strain PYR-GCK) TaxID=350054 RepID=A4TFZ7_MYCGI|nr:hypothetical protein [Mycobacterium sp. shizuoka-1]GAY16299.1 hypothetical protein MSZK_30250 [Mycobacterium sp. shizuoka-1]
MTTTNEALEPARTALKSVDPAQLPPAEAIAYASAHALCVLAQATTAAAQINEAVLVAIRQQNGSRDTIGEELENLVKRVTSITESVETMAHRSIS